MQKILKKPK